MILLFILIAHTAYADTPDFLGDFFGRPQQQPKTSVSYQGRESERSAVRGQPSDLKTRTHEFRLGIPASQVDDKTWNISSEIRETEWRSSALIPGTPRDLPTTLWNTSVTGIYGRKLANNRGFTSSLTIGSASDKPFNHLRDSSLGLNFAYRVPAGGNRNDAKLFLLNVSTNRSFLNYVPLPGFAYFFNFSDSFKLVAGIPFLGFFAMPWDRVMVTYYYFPPVNMMARMAYRLFGPAQVYTLFRWDLRNWYLSDDTSDADERIFQEKKEAVLGLTMPITRTLLADLNGGYEFGHRIFTGDSFSSRHDGRSLRVNSGWFGQLQMKLSF